MLPATYNLELYQGDDFSLAMVVKTRNSDGTVGAAVDLTGYQASAQIRATPTANAIIASFTCTLGNQTTNTGLVTVSLSHTVTTNLPIPGSTPFAWDFQFITLAGLYETLVKGSVTVDAEVTRG